MWGFSVSILVNHSVEQDWIKWMKDIHIKEIIETKCFKKAQFCKVHHETKQEGATNYNVVFFADSQQDIIHFYDKYDKDFQKKVFDLYQQNVIFFRTELEFVEFY